MTQLDDRNFIVIIKGAGDLASGVAVRLYRCGFRLVMTEIPHPLMVRRTVSFGEAVCDGVTQVEGIQAVRVDDCLQARKIIADGKIPILVDPKAACLNELHPAVLVDAIMAKINTGTKIEDAPLVIALGPGFTAGVDCHAVVETNRGHHLGRVIEHGSAEPDTGQPGEVGGKSTERLLRAPVSGVVEAHAAIGDRVTEGQVVAHVGDAEVRAQTSGVLRGMIRSGVQVDAGTKIGDVDPRAEVSYCFEVSEKSLAIAGGVLEAIFAFQHKK
ncbi:selenium-dependent molybdenum hydroxylase system protein, YqeB family [Longilinea arvoryzae]|uniref:Selenium-dependent molybdenum hydroxylase system protein, YqeB family n=1 Tax=Longilinea arvoryzae TaxID=360412 RepID=A0A0S7BGM5_9CHLR|nr:selenium-dependent molybdenum cofactor biosynthesis protein YqeB [Longilinea arvoryzae]GAP13654.1 selenium-dependent molybdenum hydroxylase system protein, YqeB family [Longilinea arvoryzae]